MLHSNMTIEKKVGTRNNKQIWNIGNKERTKRKDGKPSNSTRGLKKNNKFMFRLCISTDIYNVNKCRRFGFVWKTAMHNFNTKMSTRACTQRQRHLWCAKIIFELCVTQWIIVFAQEMRKQFAHCPSSVLCALCVCVCVWVLFVYLKAEMGKNRLFG